MSKKNYDDLGPWSATQEKFGKWIIKKIGKSQVKIYELTGGRIWNTFLGAPCAILTTTGNKTGVKRKTPLLYLIDQNQIVLVASQGGFSTLPFWYRNLQKTPEATIQIGKTIHKVSAKEADEQRKAELWPKLDAMYEGYKEYRARTKGVREIPILLFDIS